MSETKKHVRHILKMLPDDCTLEDVQYHLYVIQKIELGLQQIERGEVYTQDEVEKYFEQWQQKSSGRQTRGATSKKSSITSPKTRRRTRQPS